MSRFEFLRSVPIGQYLPVDSILHRLDPRARMLGYAWLVLALTFSFQSRGLLLGIGAGLLGLWFGRIPLRFALRAMASPLPLIFILAVLQVFLNTSPLDSPVLVPLGRFSITQADLLAGLLLLLRFTGSGSSGAFFNHSGRFTGRLASFIAIYRSDPDPVPVLLYPLHQRNVSWAECIAETF